MTLLITIGPSIALLLYFILSDKFKEPKKIIIITFLLGVLITIPAGYLNYFIDKHFESESIINNALLHGFFSGGLVEETLKFLVLYFYVLKEKAFNEPMDAIVYGVVISLGFATLENIEYVYLFKDNRWHVSTSKYVSDKIIKNSYNSVSYWTKFEPVSLNKEYIKYKDKHEKHAEVKMVAQISKLLAGKFPEDSIMTQGGALKKKSN